MNVSGSFWHRTFSEKYNRSCDIVALESKSKWISTNTGKNKSAVVSRKAKRNEKLFLDCKEIEEIDKYKFLDSWMTQNKEDTNTCGISWKYVFVKFENTLRDRKLSFGVKNKILQCYVWSQCLHTEVRTWTVKENIISSFEMRYCRKMLKIPRTKKMMKNENVLVELMGTDLISNDNSENKKDKLWFFLNIFKMF